ncbi:MAG TPA: sigma-70 family RNA polymerase sigma factor [Gammaproteobacteria bacterium]|nr:sigma-70 family RNA polymerase sigma factor [Gammaproteobacteria bacterium]
MKLLDLLCRSHDFRKQLEQGRHRLYRVAFSWCHNAALADDLVQETLTKALKSSSQLRDPGALDTWLFSILTNCWRDHFRRSRETVDIDDIPFVHDVTPEDEHSRHEVVSKVRAAIATLPLGQRQVVTLVDLEGFSYIEVAEILDVPVGTVMSRLCRARRALKERLLDADELATATATEPRIRRVK